MSPEHANPRPELGERLRFETLFADLSSEFVNLSAGEVDREGMGGQRLALLAVELDMLSQRPPDAPSRVTIKMNEFSAQVESAAEYTADGVSR